MLKATIENLGGFDFPLNRQKTEWKHSECEWWQLTIKNSKGDILHIGQAKSKEQVIKIFCSNTQYFRSKQRGAKKREYTALLKAVKEAEPDLYVEERKRKKR
jgi:hypothetical protein